MSPLRKVLVMVEQHSSSASLPLTFAGTVQWQLRLDPERWLFAHTLVRQLIRMSGEIRDDMIPLAEVR